MTDFRFADPEFVHALWGVGVFVGVLLWLDLRGGGALEGLVGPALQGRLVRRPGAWRRRLRIALLGLAAVAAVLALMRPQWGMRSVAASRAGAEIMVALDVSKSMLAEDVAPNRLERAKVELIDLLAYLDGDQVGLIAFAGRASVVSPLTPDFGFLRLVLDETGPGSVTRGGTKLAEPIRKAVAGFGPSEGASRAILLITDGEDHDSFALDAAREAAAAGVKIIAIGFGDETGSEIPITDPRTGARSLVRDDDGRPVRTRLDGDLLRELALVTDGAYVPAGTGVLDLESIYDAHIARLTRGQLDGTRTVRDEGYPWFVLLALILLVSSAAVSAGRLRGGAAALVLGLGLVQVLLPAGGARAQPEDAAAGPADAVPADESSQEPTSREGGGPAAPAAENPREVYNRGVSALDAHSYDDAERILERARRDARGDDALRFHASYNLGWVNVQQAGRVRGDAPQDALSRLHRAADWFREALRLRPDDDGARHNLEVTLKRALVLADEMARGAESGVEGALDELAQRQRGVGAGVAGLLERVGQAMDEGDGQRGAFRAQATAQRSVLSDADQLAVSIGDERDAILARPEEERTPEDGMRATQLSSVLDHLHRARERMGQARRQLRQRQAPRAYRRAAAALVALKRARDQLREPVAVLDQLLADGTELARHTALVAIAGQELPGRPLPPLPRWLDVAGLADGQLALSERVSELHARFAAGLQHADAADPASIPADQADFLEAVRQAEPLLRVADGHVRAAAAALDEGRPDEASEDQGPAIVALADARERFLDERGLIEAIHADEQQIAQVSASEDPSIDRDEFAPTLHAAQVRNLSRAERLSGKLAAKAAEFEALAASLEDAAAGNGSLDPAPPAPDPQTVEEQRQHLEMADKVLGLARDDMAAVRKGLSANLGADEAVLTAIDWDWVGSDAESAVQHLETLRRLFFSITEHLKDVANRQLELADRTQDALARAALPDADALAEAGPMLEPQRTLGEQAGAIANGLESQSTEAAAAAEDPNAVQASERLRQAAEHVLLAQEEMEAAGGALGAPDLPVARQAQDLALEELREALEILEPPGDENSQQEQQQDQEQQQEQQGQGQDDQAQADPGRADPSLAADPAQLLQEVRDREAQRRRERARGTSPYETVEKDW